MTDDGDDGCRIEMGDCLDLMRAMPDGSVDLIVTDPPYLINTNGGGSPDRVKYLNTLKGMENGVSDEILDEMCRVLKKINLYIFCSKGQLIPLLDRFVTKMGCNWNLLTWHKVNPAPECTNLYPSDTEYILFFREHGVRVYGTYHTKRTWFQTYVNRGDKAMYGHPAVKPMTIVSQLIQNSSQEGDTVLDPFMGSGTICAAAAMLGRRYIGFEKDKKWFNVAKERLKGRTIPLF